MPHVRVLFPGRSDGIGSGPSAAQLEHKKSGNTTQFYQEVSPLEDRARDWCKKLGGMIMKHLEEQMTKESGGPWKADPDPTMTFILHEFPEGYRLFEHHTVHDGEGARDRRDTYLYGHPGGIKKRFRTPKEFFLHLWWLLTDEEGNPENCACKLCVSDELLKEVEAFAGQKAADDSQDALPAKATVSETRPVASAKPKVEVKPSNPSAPSPANSGSAIHIAPAGQTFSAPPARQVTNQPAQRATQPRPSSSGRSAPQSRMAPSEIPAPRNSEQSQDVSMGSYLYRVGELVWYLKGAAVGLGVIKGRSTAQNSVDISQQGPVFLYTLQPLSYPGARYEVKTEPEAALKPWYAYSPPGATHHYLNQPEFSQLSFDRIDWQAVVSGQYGIGDADVDASIFAAKSIDRSYTPVECINNTGSQIHYNAIYLGGEKVWRGDAVTLRNNQPATPNTSQPLEILIVTEIVENMQAASTQPGRPAPANSVHLIGDRYNYTSMPITIPTNVADVNAFLTGRIPTRIPVLPVRVAEDLLFQNRVSVMRKQVANSWRLTAAQTAVSVADVRGRWYETARMLPIISPSNFQRMRDMTGEIHDVGRSLNARGEAGGVGPSGSPGLRYSDRLEVLSRSVPQGFKFDSEP